MEPADDKSSLVVMRTLQFLTLLFSVGTSIGVDWDSILYIACTLTGQYTKEIEGS